jgi:crotonobetainyl-CoA:carnitine CoA-transferase CaiB-like acyl-CoA transferase
MDVVRYDADAPPARAASAMGDHPSAVALYAAIATGLYQRERTGRGMQVGSSLLANGAWANAYMVQAGLCGAKFIDRPPRDKALNALSNYYQTRDKRWLILTFVNEDRLWPIFAKALGRGELIEDPLFATKKDRHANARALIAILDQVFATKDLADWKRILADAKDLTFDIVVTPPKPPPILRWL